MRLGIEVTARCNAACAHCTSACGPTRTARLSTDEIVDVMDQAAAIGTAPLEFILTGGEPFLDRQQLRRLVAHGTARGAIVGCVSNGFWATSEQRAHQVLAPLQASGLRLLGISSSRFHRGFVPAERVERAITVAAQLGIRTVLKLAMTRRDQDQPDPAAIERAAARADEVERFAVIGSGRSATAIDASEWITSEAIPFGACPSTESKIADDGRFVACCSSGPSSTMFEFGNIRTQSLQSCMKALTNDPVHRELRRAGPAIFLPAVIAAGQSGRLRDAYHDVCDLCTHLLCDPVLTAISRDHAETHHP